MHSRKAFTIIEVVAAFFVLSVVVTLTLQALLSLREQKIAVNQRLQALLAAGNAMEQVTSLPWDQLRDESLKSIQAPPGVERSFQDAEVAIGVVNQEQLKKITVTVTWQTKLGAGTRSVRLVSWVSPEGRRQ